MGRHREEVQRAGHGVGGAPQDAIFGHSIATGGYAWVPGAPLPSAAGTTEEDEEGDGGSGKSDVEAASTPVASPTRSQKRGRSASDTSLPSLLDAVASVSQANSSSRKASTTSAKAASSSSCKDARARGGSERKRAKVVKAEKPKAGGKAKDEGKGRAPTGKDVMADIAGHMGSMVAAFSGGPIQAAVAQLNEEKKLDDDEVLALTSIFQKNEGAAQSYLGTSRPGLRVRYLRSLLE